MGVQERRERERQDLRAKILAAAQQIITTEGFAALSMRKLAERVEYSVGSIYLYFRNREEIARELTKVGFGQLLEMMSEGVGKKDAVARLNAVAMAYVSFGLKHPETYRLIFMGDSEYMAAAFAEEDPGDPAAKAYQMLVDVAGDLKREGLYGGRASANEIAEMVWAGLHGIVSLKIACPGFQSAAPEALAKLMVGTLVKGMVSREAVRKLR
jgi:AcrR family transcriptional regulator